MERYFRLFVEVVSSSASVAIRGLLERYQYPSKFVLVEQCKVLAWMVVVCIVGGGWYHIYWFVRITAQCRTFTQLFAD